MSDTENAGNGELFARLSINGGETGEIVLRLFPEKAPKTVRNFVGLAEGSQAWTDPATGGSTNAKLYDGTIFHRVIEGFMLQGGDPLASGRGGPGYEFEDEFDPSLKFDRPYLLGMANSGPGTNGSQFFITAGAQPHLTGRHTIFGEVVEGTNVVDTISKTSTGAADRPKQDIVLESVTIERK